MVARGGPRERLTIPLCLFDSDICCIQFAWFVKKEYFLVLYWSKRIFLGKVNDLVAKLCSHLWPHICLSTFSMAQKKSKGI